MDTALQCLAQVQDLGVAGQDLGQHNENIPDVGVISCLQAVNWCLDGAKMEDIIFNKYTPSTELWLPSNKKNNKGQLTLVSM